VPERFVLLSPHPSFLHNPDLQSLYLSTFMPVEKIIATNGKRKLFEPVVLVEGEEEYYIDKVISMQNIIY